MEQYILFGYWGPRRETSEECAKRMVDYLICLGQWDESCREWYEKAYTLKEAQQRKVTLDVVALEHLLLKGRHYTDFGHRLMEDAGYMVGIWNGRDTEEGDQGGISMLLSCGCYHHRLVNSCEIKLPYQGPIAARLLKTTRLQKLMECVVQAWEPAWAVIESCLDTPTILPGLPPRRGWMLYVAQPWKTLPVFAPPTTVVPCATHGSLIITTEERFTATNLQHVEMAQRIIEALDQAGLLIPILAGPKRA